MFNRHFPLDQCSQSDILFYLAGQYILGSEAISKSDGDRFCSEHFGATMATVSDVDDLRCVDRYLSANKYATGVGDVWFGNNSTANMGLNVTQTQSQGQRSRSRLIKIGLILLLQLQTNISIPLIKIIILINNTVL